MPNGTMDPETGVAQRMQGVPPRIMSKQMAVYYSNCAMVATSPKDVSLFFGRYVPAANEKGEQSMAEFYEHQVYMTVDQAEDLARILSQTVELLKSKKNIGPVSA